MLSFALATLALAALTSAAAPNPWTATVNVILEGNTTIVRAEKTVRIPELQGDGLTVELDKYDGLEYYACFKLGAAAPVAAGRNNWDTAGYCELFHFVNTTTTTTTTATSTSTVKRAVLRVPANLRGVGSRAGAVAAESVVVDSVHSNEHARRSVTAAGARGVAVQNVRAGTYYITIAAINAIASNTTLSLKLSGMACPGAGQYGPACAALAPVSEGVSFPFNGVAANGSAAARFGDSKLINDTTAALTIAAQVDTADGSVDVLARWGGVPTADLHDAKLVVGDKGVHTAQVVAPRAANWYFAVLNNNNKTAVNANITVTLTQCGAGLFGLTCNTTVADLDKPGQVADHDQVAVNDAFYYKFNANATAAQFRAQLAGALNADALAVAAALTLDPDATVNATAPSIYARRGALPTTTDFDFVDCTVASCADDQNTLIVASDDVAHPETDQLWYVLVVANSPGSLHVWNAAGGACAGNCNNHGKCNTELATCTCDEDYSSFDCLEKSALERWMWALIIGGAVLVAIGLIGCIVYFIQRQSRRAGFERV